MQGAVRARSPHRGPRQAHHAPPPRKCGARTGAPSGSKPTLSPLSECPRRRGFLQELSEAFRSRGQVTSGLRQSGPHVMQVLARGGKSGINATCAHRTGRTQTHGRTSCPVCGAHAAWKRGPGVERPRTCSRDRMALAKRRPAEHRPGQPHRCPPETAQPLSAHFPGTDSLHFHCIPLFLRFTK